MKVVILVTFSISVSMQEEERHVLHREQEELKEAFAEHERLENDKVHRTKEVGLPSCSLNCDNFGFGVF